MSERRACRVIDADRKSVRYRSTRDDDAGLREKLRELANQRRRFGYRRLHILLRREGIMINRKKTQRLYKEEGLAVIRTQDWKYLTHTCYRRSIGAFEKFDQLDGFQGSYDLLFKAQAAGGDAYSFADREPEVLGAMKSQLAKARQDFDAMRTVPAEETFPR